MSFLNILFIAVALSFDGMAVSAANSAKHPQMSIFVALRVALLFGFFHMLMPLVGWVIGTGLEQIISRIDHWIAFILLSTIGIKMIFESFKSVEEKEIDIYNIKILLLLAVATSVDALVTGITFAFLPVNIWFAVSVISLTTFILSLISIYIGKKCGQLWGNKAEVIGGIILVIIGFKILISHFTV